MIENMTSHEQPDRHRAKRMVIAPSSSLRRHFVSLARQVHRWGEDRQHVEKRPLTIGVTALAAGAGKSTVAYNLSSALCSIARARTLLVESDFGQHYITRRLGQARSAGLSELLIGVADLDEIVHETPIHELQVIGCGQKSDQEAVELPFDLIPNLFSGPMSDYGYAVFDLPVASNLTACQAIAPFLDGLILTVEANQIDHRQITRFRKNATDFDTEVIGMVINKS